MLKAIYATHESAKYRKHQVVVIDTDKPEEYGLLLSGYFAEIPEPEERDATEGAPGA
jgi:hypothetical protein